jgi:hypothetical protein
MRLLVVMGAASVLLGAQSSTTGLPPEVELLARIRVRMLWNLEHQPNYTCVETVERSRRAGAARKFQLQDTLRLEVALVDGKEMFAWPGARKFEETDLRNMVTTGAFGNGNFALHARSIFAGNTATFDYRGEEPIEQRGRVRYDFRIPRFLSGYHIRISEREAIVGYHGSFHVDPKTLDLERLEVVADDIPVELGLSSATDRVDYARMTIGDGQFLLPAGSELSMVDMRGQESRNRVRFASCRQFTGESVLSFGEPPPETAAATPVREVGLPPGLGLTLSLLDEINTEAAAVGDPVRALLDHDLKHKGQLLFPKGAVASGRVTRLERRSEYTILGLEFFEIQAQGLHARLQMALDSVPGLAVLAARGRLADLKPDAGEGLIPLRGGRVHLSRGILMFWRT